MKWFKSTEVKEVPMDGKYVAPHARAWVNYAEIEIVYAIIEMTNDVPSDETERLKRLAKIEGLKLALEIVKRVSQELDEKINHRTR
jgi:predicted solute-binding protein